VEPAQVATAVGCSGANFLAVAALVRPGDEVIVERPTYDPLLGMAALFGAAVKRFDRTFDDRYRVDPDRVTRLITPRTRLIAMTSPNNPTGVRIDEEALTASARRAGEVGAFVLVDEVYRDAPRSGPVGRPGPRPPNVVSTNSLTKSYGLNALRCGWAIAAPAVIERLRRMRDLVDVIGPPPTERMAAAAFGVLDRLEARARAVLAANVPHVERFLASRPELEWVEPDGGSLFFPRFADGRDASPFAERLASRFDTAVAPGRFFEAPSHFRLAASGRPSMVEAALERLDEALSSIDR
jgi:aspartate/methionine/tyrosine aminotransferase